MDKSYKLNDQSVGTLTLIEIFQKKIIQIYDFGIWNDKKLLLKVHFILILYLLMY